MLLHEIIEVNESGKKSILIELLHPYKNSLYVYYKRLFCCEPVLMVTDVTNAAQYALIVPSNEFNEAIGHYYNDENMTEEEREQINELVSFQSVMLKDF